MSVDIFGYDPNHYTMSFSDEDLNTFTPWYTTYSNNNSIFIAKNVHSNIEDELVKEAV
jgi:hypothetical protein